MATIVPEDPAQLFANAARTLLDRAAQAEHESTDLEQKLDGKIEDFRAYIDSKLSDLSSRVRTETIVVRPQGDRHTVQGTAHKALADVVALASQRSPVLMVGPTGCGKTHLAGQVAEALGLGFSFISVSGGISESALEGWLLPVEAGGRFSYVPAGFVEAYENGGVFLLDELDGAMPDTLLVINAALANGKMALPKRHGSPVVTRHPDFVCLAAANTWGTGADRRYVGRSQLDAATLDRFLVGQIEMDYDEDLEAAICSPEVTRRGWALRKKVRAARLERSVSTRFLRDASTMVAAGWTLDRAFQGLFAGWTDSERSAVR